MQEDLWLSSLPLGRDKARKTKKYITRNVGDTIPLVGTSCGSPTGIPFVFSKHGRTVECFNPYDPAHDNFTCIVNGKSGSGKTLLVNVLISRCLSYGARGFIIDRAGHYEFLTSLVPRAEHVDIGELDGATVNPWDTPDCSAVPNEKVSFLVSLHALLLGNTGEKHGSLSPLDRNLLEAAIRHVYEKAARSGKSPTESQLHKELLEKAGEEKVEGTSEIGDRYRHLAECLRSFCGEGTYAYLLDRETSLPEESPLIAFDTRKVPDDISGAVTFSLAEYVSRKVEARRSRYLKEPDSGGLFAGKTFLVLEEVWKLFENDDSGSWVNDRARRARHEGLFLIAVTQQLSDFSGKYGKALLRNSTQQFQLKQAVEELEYVRDASRLSDEEIAAISRLKTVKRRYSELYWINGTRGRAIVELRVGPKEYWIATSDPLRDVPEREAALAKHDGDSWKALNELCQGGLADGRSDV